MDHLSIPLNFNKELKICLLGEGGVGKSSLAVQFVQGIFISKYDPTIEDVYKKIVEIDGKVYNTEILDTAGTETFVAMRDLYIRNSQGFLIVYSITSQATFNQLESIYNQIMNIKKKQPGLVLVGNKIDLSEDERVISREKGQMLADRWMCPFYETSAKHSINVHQIFFDLIKQIDHQKPYIRKASRQENMPLPIRNYFCCPFFKRNKSKDNHSQYF